ncbi:hypothetical protein cypCar_00040541 [Cyprinus carpio]|nr:hypothetical protein cypCar_00040541 [Cyprinus carpio]
MEFIKEEGEAETCSEQEEDTEEQRDLMEVKGESQELNEVKEKHQNQGKSSSSSENEKNVSPKRADAKGSFSCSQCGKRFTRKGHLEVHMDTLNGETTSPIIPLSFMTSSSVAFVIVLLLGCRRVLLAAGGAHASFHAALKVEKQLTSASDQQHAVQSKQEITPSRNTRFWSRCSDEDSLPNRSFIKPRLHPER